MNNKYKLLLLAALVITISWATVHFFNHDKRAAKDFAEEFYAIPLPPKTKIIDQDFNYGVYYGGGPWGSGGRPTVVAYKKLSSELSEKDLVDHYTSNPPLEGVEIYFKWDEKDTTTAVIYSLFLCCIKNNSRHHFIMSQTLFNVVCIRKANSVKSVYAN